MWLELLAFVICAVGWAGAVFGREDGALWYRWAALTLLLIVIIMLGRIHTPVAP